MTIQLAERVVLVQLNISQWNAKKLDRKVTEEVSVKHGATKTASVGNYNKSLLPSGEVLKDVFSKTSLIRRKYLDNTLPWGLDGTQLLPAKNYMPFMQEFESDKTEWLQLVDTFISCYADMVARAEHDLGSMFNQADYPSLRDVRSKFKIAIVKLPLPTDDFRLDISGDELTRIQQEVTARLSEASKIAMKEAWDRLYERVKHLAEKLNDPEAQFRDTLVSSTKELCELLTRMNITDDPELEALRSEVEQSFANEEPKDLRSDMVLRKAKAKKATDIKDKMSAFMGPVQ